MAPHILSFSHGSESRYYDFEGRCFCFGCEAAGSGPDPKCEGEVGRLQRPSLQTNRVQIPEPRLYQFICLHLPMCISTDMWVKLNQIVSNAQNFCYGINAIRPHALSCADRASGCNRESEREGERESEVCERKLCRHGPR